MKYSKLIFENEQIEELFFNKNMDRILGVIQDGLMAAGIQNFKLIKEELDSKEFYTPDSFRIIVKSDIDQGYASVSFSRSIKQDKTPADFVFITTFFSKKLTKQQSDIKNHTRIKVDDNFIENLRSFFDKIFNETNNKTSHAVIQSLKEKMLETLKKDVDFTYGGCAFTFNEMQIKEDTDKTLMLDVVYDLVDSKQKLFNIRLQNLYLMFTEGENLKALGGFSFDKRPDNTIHPHFNFTESHQAVDEMVVLIRQLIIQILEEGFLYLKIRGEVVRNVIATTLPKKSIFDRRRGDMY
jgi:hypothetical protein